MAPESTTSNLKRARHSQGEVVDPKKPRRSQRLSQPGIDAKSQLPSPITNSTSASVATKNSSTTTPPPPQHDQSRSHLKTPPLPSPAKSNIGLPSPLQDTQAFSQINTAPQGGLTQEVEDEEAEGVWGYLVPLDHKSGDTLVLRQRIACPLPEEKAGKNSGDATVAKHTYAKQETEFEDSKISGVPSGGYLIGRHPECDRVLDIPTISNRHCLLFRENRGGKIVAVVEDLSGNGTYVNNAFVGRNKRRDLAEGDELAILDEAHFIFRYPRSAQHENGFSQQYAIQEQLGKGHFATVYLAINRTTGNKFAVKKFEKRAGPGERSKIEGLQQEIGVLMSVSHPSVLCLKDTFDESDGVYLILELAPEGELFNLIVQKSKLSETETRKVFIQLFKGLKYLHERNIVHRDIKPENILLEDQNLSVKLADFGLAKIIGEESFTTTLCGTPSYVAPEILENTRHRRYTRAVDVWSLGVVLYICLCGFPPFSDELFSPENPYNLSQQIKMGRFDYPSPYWDPVSDDALDLIDRMLTVDPEKRITVDACLEHQWTTQKKADPADSTDGLTGALGTLDVSHRKPKRERTLLSSMNEIKLAKVVPVDASKPSVKVYDKNKSSATKDAAKTKNGNAPTSPGATEPQQFMQYGIAKDQPLFGDDTGSIYQPAQSKKAKARSK